MKDVDDLKSVWLVYGRKCIKALLTMQLINGVQSTAVFGAEENKFSHWLVNRSKFVNLHIVKMYR